MQRMARREGMAEGDAPIDFDWYRKQQQRQTQAKQKPGVAEGEANAGETLRSQIIKLYKRGLEDYDIAYDLDIDEKIVADIIDDYDRKQQQRRAKQQGMAEASKEKTPGVALSTAYQKDFDGIKPVNRRPETALTGTYSKTGKPGGELKKRSVAEGGYPEVDHMPGPTIKRTQTGCKRCHGKGYVYKTPDGETHPMNRPDAKKYKCGKCDGIGFVKLAAQGVAETNVEKYKDLGATNQTTHFIKNVTTGKIVSPHRSLEDAENALVGNERGSNDQFKIVRARKSGVAEGVDPATYPARAQEAHEKYLKYENMVDQELRKLGQRLPQSWDAARMHQKLSSDAKYALALKYYDLSEKFASLSIRYEELAKKRGMAEADPHKFDSDVDYYTAQNTPARSRHRGQQSPGVNPDDEAYFREIFRKKRAAAEKVKQDNEQGVAEGSEQVETDIQESQEGDALLARIKSLALLR
jgi:hypothetical protein